MMTPHQTAVAPSLLVVIELRLLFHTTRSLAYPHVAYENSFALLPCFDRYQASCSEQSDPPDSATRIDATNERFVSAHKVVRY